LRVAWAGAGLVLLLSSGLTPHGALSPSVAVDPDAVRTVAARPMDKSLLVYLAADDYRQIAVSLTRKFGEKFRARRDHLPAVARAPDELICPVKPGRIKHKSANLA
jgi:hypothetical protein